MPLEKIRILSLMVFSATLMGYLSGDLTLGFFLIQMGSIVPLWFDLDLNKIRDHFFWKVYGFVSFTLFIGMNLLSFPLKTSIFFLVLFCVIYEFYGEKRPNAPLRLISLLSFLIVIYQARLNSDIYLFLGILAYLGSVLICLMSFYQSPIYNYRILNLLRQKFAVFGAQLFMVFFIGLGVFWVLPRIPGQSFSNLPNLAAEHLSGFSNRVSLNDIGYLKLSHKHVMDLAPLDDVLHNSYLKGNIFDYYERGFWSSTNFFTSYPKIESNQSYKLPRPKRKPVYGYRVDLEPLYENTLFYFNLLQELRGDIHPLEVRGALEKFSVLRYFPSAFTYEFFATHQAVPHARQQSLKPYLRIPPGLDYLNQLALDIIPDTSTLSNQQIAAQILAYFSTDFQYTLEINNRGASDPIKDFLSRKEGHCELFASSMALLLRANRVPSRLVTGFLVPEIHPSGDFYHIRQSDAHAWVEYLHEGHWFSIDPTPAGFLNSPSVAENQIAYFKRFWRNNIINWDFDSQTRFLLASYRNSLRFLDFSFSNPRVFLIPLLLLLLLAFIKFRLKLFRFQNRIFKRYRTIKNLLGKKFSPQEPWETFLAYSHRIRLEPPLQLSLSDFLEEYNLYRFGSQTLPKKRLQSLINKGNAVIFQIQKPGVLKS